jgi:hypothetical protein
MYIYVCVYTHVLMSMGIYVSSQRIKNKSGKCVPFYTNSKHDVILFFRIFES